MISREKAEEVLHDLKQICIKHSVVLFGTCYCEGIEGEINIASNNDFENIDIYLLNRSKDINTLVETDPSECGICTYALNIVKGE